jgi:hypothetical protein
VSDLDDLRERLQAISDELADLAMDRLSQALHDGATERPMEERRLTRARHAVDKAIALLSVSGREGPDDDS